MAISSNIRKVLSLLHNARQLAVTHQRRTLAADVISACHLYAKDIRLPVEDDFFEDLAEGVRGKNNLEMTAMFDRAELEVLAKSDSYPDPVYRDSV